MELEVIELPLSALKPYSGNAKLHPDEQILEIKESIKAYGFLDPIAFWGEDNTIVEGHGRYIAAQELGMETIPCIRLDHLTDEQRRAYTLVHNQLTLTTGFDLDKLERELAELPDFVTETFHFDLDEMRAELEDEDGEDSEGEQSSAKEDDFDEDAATEAEPFVKPGDLILLGRHRLLCGDSTNPEDIARLMDGKKANLS